MRNGRALLLILVLASPLSATDLQQRPTGIGSEISEQIAASYGISVLPSGAGLPRGSGTARQGRQLFVDKCAACHGESGEGRAEFPALVGGIGSLSTDKPVLTVGSYWPMATTLFDYIWRAMPYQAPGSLTADETYAITAWILNANGIIREREVLNQKSLIRVRMPNRDGFVPDSRPDATTRLVVAVAPATPAGIQFCSLHAGASRATGTAAVRHIACHGGPTSTGRPVRSVFAGIWPQLTDLT